MLGLLLDNWLRGNASLLNSLAPALDWATAWIRSALIQEATLMGWPLAAETPAYWYMSRGAGLIAYLLLWGAAAWGLVVSTKVARGLIAASAVTGLHEFLSLAALAFAGFHALVLLGDSYINFSVIDISYPFAASYQPGRVGLGQMAFYLSAILILSFYARKQIGHKTWRWLHYLTFLTYAIVLAHGFTTGTDSAALPVRVMYIGTGAVIVFLIYYRLLSGGQRKAA
jgi:predicted ferric reductase